MHRARKLHRAAEGEGGGRGGGPRRSWARLLRRILEVDPLLCSRCGVAMRIVAVITDPAVLDRILGHLAEHGGRDPFDARAPPEG